MSMFHRLHLNFVHRNVDMAEYLSSDPDVLKAHPCTQFDLIANICHEGTPGRIILHEDRDQADS